MFMPYSLITGSAGIACLYTRQLPDHPVRSLKEPRCLIIDFRILVDGLPYLWDQPFRRYLSPVTSQEFLSALFCHGIELIGLILCCMMFPQLDPGIGPFPEFIKEAEGGAVSRDRQHCACSKINAYACYLIRAH